MPQFNLENLRDCQEEIDKVLREEHWPEVGHYKDIPIDMQWDKYAMLQERGVLRCYTVREFLNEEFGETILQGYAFYLFDKHLHYKHTPVAMQDILYVREPYRGIGRSFIDWCDNQMFNEGAETTSQHIKPWFDWSSMAESLGYKKAETIMTRRRSK